MIVARAPLQICLAGEATLGGWASQFNGAAVCVAINHYSYALCTDGGNVEDVNEKWTEQYLGLGVIEAGCLAVNLACDYFHSQHKHQNEHHNDFPESGASIYGGVKITRKNGPETIAFNVDHYASLPEHLMVFQLLGRGVNHRVADISLKQEMHALVRTSEAVAAAISDADYKRLGSLVEQGLRLELKTHATVIDNEANDALIKSRLAGAYGGRFDDHHLILVAPPDRHEAIEAAIDEDGIRLPFDIDYLGARIMLSDAVKRR